MVAVHASCGFRDKVDQITLVGRFYYSHFRIMERVYVLSLGKPRVSTDWYLMLRTRCNFSRAFRYSPATRDSCASKCSNDSLIEWFADVTRTRGT